MVHATPAECNRLAVPITEAARLLSLSERKVHYLIADGTLPSIRIGRRRLIRVADLQAFLDHCQVVTPESA